MEGRAVISGKRKDQIFRDMSRKWKDHALGIPAGNYGILRHRLDLALEDLHHPAVSKGERSLQSADEAFPPSRRTGEFTAV